MALATCDHGLRVYEQVIYKIASPAYPKESNQPHRLTSEKKTLYQGETSTSSCQSVWKNIEKLPETQARNERQWRS